MTGWLAVRFWSCWFDFICKASGERWVTAESRRAEEGEMCETGTDERKTGVFWWEVTCVCLGWGLPLWALVLWSECVFGSVSGAGRGRSRSFRNPLLGCCLWPTHSQSLSEPHARTDTRTHTRTHGHAHARTHTRRHTHTHTHTCWFLWFMGTFHRRNGFYTVQAVCAIALHLPYT